MTKFEPEKNVFHRTSEGLIYPAEQSLNMLEDQPDPMA
jgi:hypothetical protein